MSNVFWLSLATGRAASIWWDANGARMYGSGADAAAEMQVHGRSRSSSIDAYFSLCVSCNMKYLRCKSRRDSFISSLASCACMGRVKPGSKFLPRQLSSATAKRWFHGLEHHPSSTGGCYTVGS